MRSVRRGFGVVLALALTVATLLFALRWVDVPTREVAAVQAVVPLTGAAVVLVTLVALVGRYRRLALVGAVPSLVTVALAVSSLGLTPAADPGGGDTVTVLSSNMEFGGADAGDLVAGVRDHRADVAVFVELTPAAVQRLEAAGIAEQLPYVVGTAEAGTTGAQIRSRWPLTLLDAGKGTGGSLFWEPYARVDRPEGAFRVKAVHTRQPIVSARGWQQDLDRLRTWQQAQPTEEPLFMAGDFNASEGHPAFRAMLDGLVDLHRAAGEGWVRTWPQGRRVPPFVQLDHVVARGVTTVAAGVVPVQDTDHAAVWGTVLLG